MISNHSQRPVGSVALSTQSGVVAENAVYANNMLRW